MDLDRQIQQLIAEAPQDGTTPQAIAAIAPLFKELAQKLQHSEYYVLQTLDGRWVMTTLSNTRETNRQKTVIYGFPTLKDAADHPYSRQDPQVMATPVGTIKILFQLLAMEGVDSLVFFQTSGQAATGTEVKRSEVQTLIQTHLQQMYPTPRRSSIPPNLA
ncbi:hypothetical protein H6G20_10815 [Desertifilum sp. FACHB-1129]|uniref:Uncharacterized protein n=2 Tax=Desertifilum tharense IPPAS B-1220 TaxID=1781255 RepID=A0A1E5QCN5_9CYAN|nr:MULTISPECIES: hypothetical protein [Desertifilum]MDA0211646.1 hypothetical protein [Cyanobacteria bacterium FC1]MBD2312153.1 hypothetical protein [Desertifilum sp. FACHB-1129]MBD2322185.1 hypothetical protein [Desertifilum sp. FACHB-866]MBD2332222.1 hypothetical protein [Desertifilum sp. FACHB-868]OEJ72415.1 hypothetical protein BH720_25410 [Desertifilum tharense IPPAS B-1220]